MSPFRPFPPRLAEIYDLVFADESETRDQIAALRAIFDRHAGRAVRDVLDLAAGTGRLALPLAAGGLRVTAVDASPAMLDVLARRATADGLSVATRSAWAHDLADVGAFDAIVCVDSFYYLADEGLPERVLSAAARALRPGGVLVLDTYNYFFADLADEHRTVSLDLDGGHVQVFGIPALVRAENVLLYTNQVEVADASGETWTYETTDAYRHFAPLEIKAYLLAAGFSSVRQFPGFGALVEDGEPDDGMLVTVGVK
jgi:SAM-dependent methyltransferase